MGREWLGRVGLALLGLLAALGALEVVAGLAPGLWVPGAVRSPHALQRLQAEERRAFRARHGRQSRYGPLEDSRVWRVGASDVHYRVYGLDHTAVVATNVLGLRDRDPAERPAGRSVLLLLGDSFVEARQVPAPQAVARQLERRLAQREPVPPWVVNAGIGATGTTNQLHLLERLVPVYRPARIVLVFFAGNDLVDNTLPLEALARLFDDALRDALAGRPAEPPGEARTERPHYRVAADGSRRYVPAGTRLSVALRGEERTRFQAALAARRGQVERCLASLAGWRRFRRVAVRLAPDAVSLLGHRLGWEPAQRCAKTLAGAPPQLWLESAAVRARYPDWWREAWEVTLFLLGSVRDVAARAGAELAVVILPPAADAAPALRARLLRGYRLEDFEALPERPAETLARRLAAAGIPALDLTPALRDHPDPAGLYLPLDPHLSAAGHAWLAEQIDRALAALW